MAGSAGSLLILGVSALVATCAVLSAFGFRGRASVVGIDLGTTYSVVAISDARAAELAGLRKEKAFVPAARVIAYEDGEVLTPSVVGFDGEGVPVVGRDVLARGEELSPVIRDAKRFVGRAFDDVQAQAKEYQFRVVRNGSKAAFEVGGSTILPEEIGSLVVRRLVEVAKRDLGHDVVTSAVIAVPAAFGADQIRATADAFKLAGLRVARVLKEPVAAAVAYGLNKKTGVDHVLVYDFGGGTLDVSVLYVQDGSVEVVANHGDNDLGGTDFDHCLLRALETALTTAQSPNVVVVEDDHDEQHGEDCGRASVLLRLAEAMKIELSEADSATIRCRDAKKLTVTRDAFETSLCGHLFERAVATVHETLETSMIRTSDIDEVVLVGGTSRIPKVRSDLRTALGVTKLNTDIDPDVTVAVGAASVID